MAVPADAAGKKKRNRAHEGQMLSRFDRNADAKIDGQEAERVRAAFSDLSALDTDHDGKLSDSEISAAKVPAGKRKKKQ